jgi:hypothetical protein
MAKVTQLIQAPSITELPRQVNLVIVSLAKNPVVATEVYQNRLLVISMRTTRLLTLNSPVLTNTAG